MLNKALSLGIGWALLPLVALAENVTIFAASSMREAVQDVALAYEAETGHEVTLVFAATSAVARQVVDGAPADAVILADQDWVDWAVPQLDGAHFSAFAGNRLVLISHSEMSLDIGDLPAKLNDNVLAMAQVDAVPAGRYGREALTPAGIWAAVEPNVVQAANVRAALRFVQRGDAAFGVGYASDLVALPDLTEAYAFPPATHGPIVYSVGTLTDKGAAFASYLTSPSGTVALTEWGFAPQPGDD